MDFSKFIKAEVFKLPDGKELTLQELTLNQRQIMFDWNAKKDQATVNAKIIAMSCEEIKDDEKAVKQIAETIPQQLSEDMVFRILTISGLHEGSEDESKKNLKLAS